MHVYHSTVLSPLYRLKSSFRPCLNPLTPSTLRSLGIDCVLITASLLPQKAWHTLQLLNHRLNNNMSDFQILHLFLNIRCERNPLFQWLVLCYIDQTSSNKRQVNFMTLWPPAVNVLLPRLRSVTALDLGPPLPTAYYFVLPEGQLAVSAASNSLVFAKLSQWNEPVRKKIITLI